VLIVVALGGNALLHRGDHPDADLQANRLAAAAPALARLAAENDVVIVHGNGPQVGLLAAENAGDRQLSRPYPLADMVAESQGLIGHWIQRALAKAGLAKDVVVLVSRTLVDSADDAFRVPTKFIGPILSSDRIADLTTGHGWTIARDGTAWRRVVASPAPIRILETERTRSLLNAGTTVVVAGGGGIPVIATGDSVDAVVDKDLAAARIAQDLDAELLIILTDVDGVMTHYGTPQAKLLTAATPADLAPLQFSPGSMGPKVTAAAQFASTPGHRAVIASLDQLEAAVAGTAGTQIAQIAEMVA
jgi:carbamate kinase